MTDRFVNTAADSGGDGTTNNTSSGDGTHAYNTLSAAETGEAGVLSAPLVLLCSGGADGGAVLFDAASWTTSGTNKITIKPNTGQEHGGQIDTGKYHKTSTGTYQLLIRSTVPNFFVEGIQALLTQSNVTGFNLVEGNSGLFACLAKGDNSAGQDGLVLTGGGAAATTIHIVNCLAYNCAGAGIRKAVYNASIDYTIYSNTIDNCGNGLIFNSGFNTFNNFNNLLTGNTTDYSGSSATTDNNVTSDATSPDTAHRNKTVTYDAGADVFTTSDADVVGLGTDLSADSLFPFSTDIAGVARGATWDIGAFQDIGAPPSGRIMSSLAHHGGLCGPGGIAGASGGLAG